MANWLQRILGGKEKAAEGAYRPGPYLIDGGWLSASFNLRCLHSNPFGAKGLSIHALPVLEMRDWRLGIGVQPSNLQSLISTLFTRAP